MSSVACCLLPVAWRAQGHSPKALALAMRPFRGSGEGLERAWRGPGEGLDGSPEAIGAVPV